MTPDSARFCTACVSAPIDGADELARKLVGKRLAACAQVVSEGSSYYWWQGSVESDPESYIMLKTRTAWLPRIDAFLASEHPYDVPELVAMPIIGGSAAYLKWLDEELTENRSSGG